MHKSMVLFLFSTREGQHAHDKNKTGHKVNGRMQVHDLFFMNIKLENMLQKEGGSLC